MIKHRFTKQGLWILFTAVAFPIHVWALLMIFRDMDWVTRRTNAWDALGVAAYGLVIAFFESVFVFSWAVILSYLLPKKWTETQRIVMMGLLFFIMSLWGILGQLYFLTEFQIPSIITRLMLNNPHPLRVVIGVFLILVLITIIPPVYGVLKSEKFIRTVYSIFERLSLLTAVYLVLDALSLGIIIFRNL